MSTMDYIHTLESLKPGDLSLLRTHAGQGIDKSSQAFDLFAGLWWPLRQKSQRAPRREVAWLIAKLYAFCPLQQREGYILARQLSRCQPRTSQEAERFRQRIDGMLVQPISSMEEPLRWALAQIAAIPDAGLDWVRLTDDLSIWEREDKREGWGREYLGPNK
jgi:CRISPR type I-E-associated protein CasB/Cse2